MCECPGGPPSCPPGVSSVPDGCGCCKVCAAQLNQDCHDSHPCDHHKGLECNYGNDVGRTHGICRGMYTIQSGFMRVGFSLGLYGFNEKGMLVVFDMDLGFETGAMFRRASTFLSHTAESRGQNVFI